MMNDLTCIIIGGGHAGLSALKAIKRNNPEHDEWTSDSVCSA